LEGREADDEAMFEKRYKEYMQENEDIIREYRERGLLVEVDTGKGTEESWEKLCNRLAKDIEWTDAIGTSEWVEAESYMPTRPMFVRMP
jgi:hypothetical protein